MIADLPIPELPAAEVPTTRFGSIVASRSAAPNLRDFPFSMGEVFEALRTSRRLPPGYFEQMEEIRRLAAEFRERHIRPVAHEIERRVAEDPGYFPQEIVRQAAPYRFLTLIVPRELGGPGYMTIHAAIMAEELAAGCGGLATSLAVSSAGLSQVLMGLDPFLCAVHMREAVEAEARGEPILWSGAVTEPNAGSDRWDLDFQNMTRAGMVARRVEGGFVLSGRKMFISNGSVAKYSFMSAALDPKDPKGTGCGFIVATDSPGFSVGRVEHKMGQKASPTTEQICDQVFVPERNWIGVPGIAAEGTTLYLAASRGPVGAIGVGCGRRALESLVRWAASRSNHRGKLLDQQALQMKIAGMARDLTVARNAYVQACLTFDGMFYDALRKPAIRLALAAVPKRLLRSQPCRRLAQSSAGRRFLVGMVRQAFPPDRVAHVGGLAAMAKVVGSSTGRRIAGEVMQIMGPDAADPRWGVDKAFRDARLTEIYEGTNEICGITTFKSMAASFSDLPRDQPLDLPHDLPGRVPHDLPPAALAQGQPA
jgi:butyryl-CoA dehydrogenase